jgi:hypothetical protein
MLGSSRNIWDFEPRSVPGCGLWLDAADSSAVTIATGVSGWRDKSGNAYNLTQSTTESQPSYASNLITFSNNTHLNVPQAAVNNLSSWSLFFVINPISSSNWIMSKQKNGANSYNILSMTYNTGSGGGAQVGSNGFLYWRSFNAGSQLVSTAALATSTLQICNLTYDGTSLYFYKNGVLEKTTAGSFAISNDTGATNYTLGIRFADGSIINSGVTNFRLGEMILYSSFPDTTQRQQIEGYLSRKWGITLQNLLIPLTVSNCVLWLDADDSTKFTGGSSWLDKSGTNNHGINGTPGASTMPTVTTWTNGRKAARFVAGSKNSMKTTNSIANFVSYFMVARIQAAVGYGMLIINNLDGQRQFVMNTTSFPVALFWAPGGTAINLGSFAQGQGFVFCGTVTSGSGVGHMNGAQVGSNTNPSTSGSSQNYFGSANGDGGYLTIDIAEIIIYTGVVSSTDRQSVENYLSAKWNIPLSRSGVTLHPFNSIRPFLRRFNPIDISGCQLWLDGADPAGTGFQPTDGATVSTWVDKSGNGRNATRVGGSLTYTSTKGIVFDGGSSSYYTVPSGTFPTGNTLYSFFLIVRTPLPAGKYSHVFSSGVAAGGQAIDIPIYPSGAVETGWWTTNIVSASGVVTANTTIMLGSTYNSTGLFLYGNGTLIASSTSLGARNSAATLGYIGSTPGAVFSDQNFIGTMFEAILFSGDITTSQRQQIEGYLAYKWGLISPLPATHSYKKLPPSSSLPFSPIGISGCQLWFDASDSSTITFSSGSNVSSWRDKSINVSSTTSVAGTNVFTQNAMNGRPAILLNGSSSFTGSTTGSGNTLAVCIVATQSNTCASDGGLVCFGRAGFRDWDDNGSLAITKKAADSGQMVSTRVLNSQIVNTGVSTPFIYVLVFDGTYVNSYLNGTIQTPTNISRSGTFAYTQYKIGTRAGNDGDIFWTGFIGEVLVYNTGLTTSQRQQVEGYLAEKWGLKSSLPSTHLYRNFTPSFIGITPPAPSSGEYSNFLWTRFYNITSDPSINGPGSSGWGSLIGTAGAYNPINYQDGDSRIGQNDFVGVISKGFMYSATATVVTFRTLSDDGIAVIFNGSTVLQNWTYHGDVFDTSASVALPAGYTPIELRFFEWGGGFTCELYWSVGSTGTYVSDGTARMFHNNTSKT